MLTVHHLEKSRSTRVLWLLEELGVPYELKRYERDPVTMLAPRALRDVHPLGKSPVVTDGDAVYAESGAILEVLAERHGGGRLVPVAGTPEHLRCRYWMHYAEGSAMPPLLMKLVFETIKTKAPFLVRPVARAIADKTLAAFVHPQLATHFGWVEAELGKRPWFAGDELTIADIQMSFPVEAFAKRGSGVGPHIRAWLERVHARPAYQKALEVGGPVILG